MDTNVFKNYFDIKRFINLCRIEWFNNWRLFLLINGIISIVYINFTLLALLLRSHGNAYSYFITSLFLGIILASMSFKTVFSQEKATGYFLIPASIEEKYLVKLLLTTVFYIIFALITLVIASVVTGVLGMLFFKSSFSFFNPFQYNFLSIILNYLIFHSIFFLGAIIFKKNHFIKTALMICLLFFVVFIAFLVIMATVFSSIFFNNMNFMYEMQNFTNMVNKSTNILLIILKILIFYIMPAVFYVLGYFRLKNTEVK